MTSLVSWLCVSLSLTFLLYGPTVAYSQTPAADSKTGSSGKLHPSRVQTDLDIVFSIDSSGSMGPPPREVPRAEYPDFNRDPQNLRVKAVREFLRQLTFRHHWVGLVSWDDKVDFSIPLTKDYSVVSDALGRVDSKGGTDLELGLRQALDLLSKSPRKDARKVVLLLTDGEAEVMSSVLAQAKGLKATVYTIGLSVTPQAKRTLKRISRQTNGKYFAAPTAENLKIIFDEIFKKEIGSGVELAAGFEGQPPPYKWMVSEAGSGEPAGEPSSGWGFTPLRPGNYVVAVVQNRDETPVPYQRVRVSEGEVLKLELSSGLALEPWSPQEEPPERWHVQKAEGKQIFAEARGRWGYLPIPPGEYTVMVRQKRDEPELRYPRITVRAGRVEKLHVGQAYLSLTVTPDSLPADSGQAANVVVRIQDAEGRDLSVARPVDVRVTSSKGGLEQETITIPAGQALASTQLRASDEPGFSTLIAETSGLSAKASAVFTKTPEPTDVEPAAGSLDLIIDQPGVAVKQLMGVKAVLLDPSGHPVPTAEDRPLTFTINPIDLAGKSENDASAGFPVAWIPVHSPLAFAAVERSELTVENGGTVTWEKALGTLLVKGILRAGEAVFTFRVRFLDAAVFQVSLKTDESEKDGEKGQVVAAARRGTPTNLRIFANPRELRANGEDQSELKVLLVDKDWIPTFAPGQHYVLLLESSLGRLNDNETDLVTHNGSALTQEKIVLTASTTSGTATISAEGTDLRGETRLTFRLVLVHPAIALLLFAALGGTIGGVLRRYKMLTATGEDAGFSSIAGPFLLVNLATGLVLYLSVYYGTYALPFPFYQHEALAGLIGVLGGYVGVQVLDKLADKLGLQKSGRT